MTTAKNRSLFIFAGEASGDLHGGRLIRALKKQCPSIHVEGVAGPEMRATGIHTFQHMEDFQVMGFTDVILSLPKLIGYFKKIRDHILKTNPTAVILIDYSGFNLRMAKSLKKHGYKGKIVQYISPAVWAWGKGRIQKMAEVLDLLLTIYPFEKQYFDGTSLNVKYVGNPLVEKVNSYEYDSLWVDKTTIPSFKDLIAIFPGSRPSEIIHNFPKILEGAKLLKEAYPETNFGISVANESLLPLIEKKISEHIQPMQQVDFHLIHKQYSYELMKDCRTAIAKSGTVTLELALHHKPAVVVFQVTPFNRFIAQYLLKVNLPHYCIVNILKNREIYPELIVSGFSAQNLFHQVEHLHGEGMKRKACIDECKNLSIFLQESRASQEAAKAIEELL